MRILGYMYLKGQLVYPDSAKFEKKCLKMFDIVFM